MHRVVFCVVRKSLSKQVSRGSVSVICLTLLCSSWYCSCCASIALISQLMCHHLAMCYDDCNYRPDSQIVTDQACILYTNLDLHLHINCRAAWNSREHESREKGDHWRDASLRRRLTRAAR